RELACTVRVYIAIGYRHQFKLPFRQRGQAECAIRANLAPRVPIRWTFLNLFSFRIDLCDDSAVAHRSWNCFIELAMDNNARFELSNNIACLPHNGGNFKGWAEPNCIGFELNGADCLSAGR